MKNTGDTPGGPGYDGPGRGPPAPEKGQLYAHCEVVFPNKGIFPPEGFWQQDLINMFMFENWTKHDK